MGVVAFVVAADNDDVTYSAVVASAFVAVIAAAFIAAVAFIVDAADSVDVTLLY